MIKYRPMVQKYTLENENKGQQNLKSNQLFRYLCKYEENPSTGSKDIMGTRIGAKPHLNPPVTLKVRSMSPKHSS